MLLDLVEVVIGLVILTKAADLFVGGAARLSAALDVPPVVIGAVVVGFGTSAPEMVVSAIASVQGKLDISAGNVIGSNVANLTLVLGIAALLTVMNVSSSVLRREAPLAVGSVVLYAVLIQGGLARWEGVVLFVALVAVLALLFRGARSGEGNDELLGEVDEFLEDIESVSIPRQALLTIVGLVGVIAGAQLAVFGATDIADRLDLAEGFVGLTLIALGTSLPELVTAIAAARKGEDELIVGNLLGSNVFNSLAVGGIAGLLGPGPLQDAKVAGLGAAVMVAVVLATWLFMRTGRRISRVEATVLILAYLVTVPLLA